MKYIKTISATIFFLLFVFSLNAQNELGLKQVPGYIKLPAFDWVPNIETSPFLVSPKAAPISLQAIFSPSFDLNNKAYNYHDLALFCRLEVKMEKAFKMPVKFRIGEVQYVEKMEGKY